MTLTTLLGGDDPRFLIVRDGPIDPEGRCVLSWMQRSQRGRDNPALDLAIGLGNRLRLPVLSVFGLTADYPGANGGTINSWSRDWWKPRRNSPRGACRWSSALARPMPSSLNWHAR